jgi:hypothetical protein
MLCNSPLSAILYADTEIDNSYNEFSLNEITAEVNRRRYEGLKLLIKSKCDVDIKHIYNNEKWDVITYSIVFDVYDKDTFKRLKLMWFNNKCGMDESKVIMKNQMFDMAIDLRKLIRWKELRLVFIGHMKEHRSDCHLARLPKPIFRIVVEYVALYSSSKLIQ